MSKASVAVYFDKRRHSTDGKCPVRIRVTFNREQRFYSTGINIDQESWEKLELLRINPFDGRKKDEALKKLYEKLFDKIPKSKTEDTSREELSQLKKALSIIDDLNNNFSFESFKLRWNKNGTESLLEDKNDLLEALLCKEKAMIAQGRIGNGQSYGNAARSISRFLASLTDEDRMHLNLPIQGRKKHSLDNVLRYEIVNSDFLQKYEAWMLKAGSSPRGPHSIPKPASSTTVGIYLRQLRSVFNDAIDQKIIPANCYPFGKKGYVIPAGKNEKKAKNKDEIDKIFAYQVEDPSSFEQRSKDFWILSYLTNGINFSDLLSLRWQDVDISRNSVTFIRNKTTRTRKANQQTTTAKLFPQSIEIIERWASVNRRLDAYVFPFLSDDMSPMRKKVVISQVIKVTNEWMKHIAKKLSIRGNITTYSARHSFATILLRNKTPLAFISQALGHTNLKTTQNYLGSFGDEQWDEFLGGLLPL